ncbi:MAG: hypothetical protein ACK4UY_00710 [Dietzia sp.]
MIAGAADFVFVAKVVAIRREETDSLRAEVQAEDSNEIITVSHPEYRATVRTVEHLKGRTDDSLQVTFPPELLQDRFDPFKSPVSTQDTYVLAVVSSHADTKLSALPGCGVLEVDDPSDETRANAGLISDSRGSLHEHLPVIGLMRWAISNAVPFKDGMPAAGY